MNENAQKIVAASTLALLGWIVLEQRSLRSHVQTEIAAVRSDVSDLRERMARLEGRVDTMVDLFEGHVTGDCNE